MSSCAIHLLYMLRIYNGFLPWFSDGHLAYIWTLVRAVVVEVPGQLVTQVAELHPSQDHTFIMISLKLW